MRAAWEKLGSRTKWFWMNKWSREALQIQKDHKRTLDQGEEIVGGPLQTPPEGVETDSTEDTPEPAVRVIL